jgi:hypothetical protein
LIKPSPAAIGIGAPIFCGTRVFTRPKTKIPRHKKTRRTGGFDAGSSPESVERLRVKRRSCYGSAAHAAWFARSVSVRTFAEAIATNSRVIALSFSDGAEKPRNKKPRRRRLPGFV